MYFQENTIYHATKIFALASRLLMALSIQIVPENRKKRVISYKTP